MDETKDLLARAGYVLLLVIRDIMVCFNVQYESVSLIRINNIKNVVILRDVTDAEKKVLQEKVDAYADS